MPPTPLLPSPAQAVLGGPRLPAAPPAAPPEMRSFSDATAMRNSIYDNVLSAAREIEPLSDDKYTLKLSNVDWADPERFTRKERKNAVLTGETLARRMHGTWELIDNATQKVIERRKQVVARVPYMSSMGTFTNRGNEYTVNNQERLLPGVFARVKDNGELESHVNVLPGKGLSHRYFIDPAKSIFKVRIGQAEIPLMPLLKAMGTTDKEFRDNWGGDITAANYAKADASAVPKLAQRVLRKAEREAAATGEDPGSVSKQVAAAFEAMELDPEVTKRTLGVPHTRVNKDMILAATKKLLAVSNKEADPDDRDHLAYQQFYGPEDLFAERIRRDHGRVRRNLFRKISKEGNLAKMPSGAMTPQLEQLLHGSGLSQALEEINPAEVFDKLARVTRLGEGGIPSLDAIPEEARSVQPSHMGFMDPVRTPESFRAGVDLYMAGAARKGKDGQIYTPMRDRQGKITYKSPRDLAEATVATADAFKWKTKRIPVMRAGKFDYAEPGEVDFTVPDFNEAFSPLAHMIPMKAATAAGRVAMGSRYYTQALAVSNPESPLVQAAMQDNPNRSYEEEYGKHMGAVRAKGDGTVQSVKDGVMNIKYRDGTTDNVELYENHPFNRKSFLHQTPVVEPGDRIAKDQLLARSNYTDDKGTTALGLNARTAYFPYKGYNFEDAQVVSESFAKRMTSEHMYQHDLEVSDRHKTGKRDYVSLFPATYDKKVLDTLDDKGIVRPGQTVNYGDPLILAAKERDRAVNKIHKQGQAGYSDDSVTWKHHDPGVVTDVAWGRTGPVVVVKSLNQLKVGDKLSGRYGDKGVVSHIVPDDQMPRDSQDRPFEILLSPDGIITRTNPSQELENKLGKLAEKLGHPIKVPDFGGNEDLAGWVDQQLKANGVSPSEDVYWPEKQMKVPDISTGNRFFMKLHHTAESKGQGRGSGAYSSDEMPAKGGESGAKRLAMLDVNAMLSHGATENLSDVGNIRGQKREQFWLQFMQGHSPAIPKVPMVYEKFVDQLKAAGINVVPDGPRTQVMALTNKDVNKLAGDRMILNGGTVQFDKDLKPIPGGLFDEKLTGGHNGRQWSAIPLPEPLPNPVMEEPIRRVLGLTQKKYEAVLSGDHQLEGYGSGPAGIAKALQGIDLDREIDQTRTAFHSGKKTARDEAVRKWGYLDSAKRLGIHPKDWVLDKVPVLPPAFRPVSMLGDKQVPLVSDANYLYKEVMTAAKNYEDMKKEVGEDGVGPERLALYHAFKAVTGLADPVHPKLQEKNVKGVLKSIFGSSPKFGTVQRKLLSSTVDNVGRAVITPNPDYDLDTIGLPENRAFEVYQKHVVRRLTRRGMSVRDALRAVHDKTDLAKDTLRQEMDDRPVFVNRAPVLHKFGIMAFRPKLVSGDVLQVSPLIVKGFNADFDGDAMQFHVPTTEKAVKEAYDRLLPSRALISPADFESPVHTPGQQYLAGLYHATRKHPGKEKRPRTFRNAKDAQAAWARGDITADTPVRTMED